MSSATFSFRLHCVLPSCKRNVQHDDDSRLGWRVRITYNMICLFSSALECVC
jgi:hypothetical protein